MLRFDASGLASPAGHAVTKVGELGVTAVTLSTTALTPAGGRPPTPAIVTFLVAPGPKRPRGPLERVSHTLVGARLVRLAPPLRKKPAISATMSTVPASLATLIRSPAPTFTTTRTARVSPGGTLRLEVSGLASPAGHTVMKLLAVGFTAVRAGVARGMTGPVDAFS